MNSRAWYGYWRHGKHPTALVPVGARSVGGACCTPGWQHPTGQLHWFNFYWMIEGTMRLLVDQQIMELGGQEVLVLEPERELSGIPAETTGEYRWMTLDGKFAEEIISAFGLTPGFRLRAGKCPQELFDQLELAVQEIMPGSEYRAGALAYEILALAAAGIAGSGVRGRCHPLDLDKALLFIEQNYTSPALNVNAVAAEFGIHRSQFSRLFSNAFGISPSACIANLRFQRALRMLRESALPIAEIAGSCGFEDAGYFTRIFRQRMGISPGRFRKTM